MQQPPANSALALKIRNATSADDYMGLGLSSWQSTMSKYSISDVVIIEQQLRSKKERRNEELRCLINTTYRDLLGTTDDIQSLSEKMTKQHTLLSELSHGDIKQELATCDKSLDRWVKETKANEAQLDKSAIESILRKLLFFADSKNEQSNLLMARLFYLHSLGGSSVQSRDFLRSKYRKRLTTCLSGEISPNDLLSYCIFFSESVEDAFEQLLKLRFDGLEQTSLSKALTSTSYTLKFASKYLASASLKSSILYQLESAQFSSGGTLCETLKTELRKQDIALLLKWDALPRHIAEAASIPPQSKYSRDDKFPKRITGLLQEYCREQMGPVLDHASTESIKSRDTLEGLIDLLRDVFGLFRKSRELRSADFGSKFNLDKFVQAWNTKFHALIKENLGEVDFTLFKNKIEDNTSPTAIISFESPLVDALALVGAGKSSKIDIMDILNTQNKVTGSSAFTIVSQYEQVLQNVAKIRAVLGSLKEVFVKAKGSLEDDDDDDDEDEEWTLHVALLEKEYATSEEFITSCLAELHTKILAELKKCSHEAVDECKFVLQIALSMHEAGSFDETIDAMYSDLAGLIGTEFVGEIGDKTSNSQLVLFQSREKLTNVFCGSSSLFTVCPKFESVFMPKFSDKIDVKPDEKAQSDLLFA